jgi:hypothetical protein
MTNVNKNRPRYFVPLFQRQLLALLLQNPQAYNQFAGIWNQSYFDETAHRQIARAYLHVRLCGGEHPTEASLTQELFKDTDPWAPVPLEQQVLRKELEALYKIPVANLDYSLEEVKAWAQHQALIMAITDSVDLMQAGRNEDIVERIVSALETGMQSKLAEEDFFNSPPDLPLEVFPGVLRVESIGLLLGGSKSCKSWTLISAAIASAVGRRWLGFPECSPKRTLYCNLELHPEELKARLDILCKAMGTSRAELRGRCDFLNLKGYTNGVDHVLGQIWNASLMRCHPWRLIVIDPIYKLYSSLEGENVENSNAAIAGLFEKLEKIARELNAALLLAHHLKKGRNADTLTIDLGSGAGTFARGPDAILGLRPLEEEGTWSCEPVLRYFKRMEKFGLRLEFPLLMRDANLDLEEVAGRPGAPKTYRAEDALLYLPSEGLTSKEWQDSVELHLDCNVKTFRTMKQEAIERKLVRLEGPRNKHGTKYFVTEAGTEAIRKAEHIGKLQAKAKLLARARTINGNGQQAKIPQSERSIRPLQRVSVPTPVP